MNFIASVSFPPCFVIRFLQYYFNLFSTDEILQGRKKE